jgi:hypothetical protein
LSAKGAGRHYSVRENILIVKKWRGGRFVSKRERADLSVRGESRLVSKRGAELSVGGKSRACQQEGIVDLSAVGVQAC